MAGMKARRDAEAAEVGNKHTKTQTQTGLHFSLCYAAEDLVQLLHPDDLNRPIGLSLIHISEPTRPY